MTLTLTITSPPKGSNPGGECVINGTGANFNAYYKHVYGPNSIRDTPFIGVNQPIYEVLVNELARQLGLKTARTYVLLNWNKDMAFNGWEPYAPRSPANRAYYYISHIIKRDTNHSTTPDRPDAADAREEAARNVVAAQEIYLESILVDDIIGKRQNYTYATYDNDTTITYLDLGCGFVRATGGKISIPHKVAKYKTDRKTINRLLKRLRGNHLVGADDNTFVDLAALVQQLPTLPIPTLNPKGVLTLDRLLSVKEIEFTQAYIAHSLVDQLPSFKERELIFQELPQE